MVYEDECEDGLSLTLSATGNLDASQTRQALHLGWKWPIGRCHQKNTIKHDHINYIL